MAFSYRDHAAGVERFVEELAGLDARISRPAAHQVADFAVADSPPAADAEYFRQAAGRAFGHLELLEQQSRLSEYSKMVAGNIPVGLQETRRHRWSEISPSRH